MSFFSEDDSPVDTVDMFETQGVGKESYEVVCPYCGHLHEELEQHGICKNCGKKLIQV